MHPGGNTQPAIDAVTQIRAVKGELERLGIFLESPPQELPEKLKRLMTSAAMLVPLLEGALIAADAEGALHLVFRQALDETFNRRGASIASEAVTDSYLSVLRVHHAPMLFGGRLVIALAIGGLHAGPLRSMLGMGINKIDLGVAHAVKKTDESPAPGDYMAAEGWHDLNKGHHDGGTTTQSCIVNKLDSVNVKTKTIPYTDGGRLTMKQPEASMVPKIYGALDKKCPISGKLLPPALLGLEDCFAPQLSGLMRAKNQLMAFLNAVTYAEEPSTQFGPDWSCKRLCDNALGSSKALGSALDALHPPYRTDKGYHIDWKVLSQHLWLDHLADEDFCQMCEGPVTLGRLVEDCFETMHVFSKGAIHCGIAPPHAGYNKLSMALRRLSRMALASLRRDGVARARAQLTRKAWLAQQPGRARFAEWGAAAAEWVERCKENKRSEFTADGGLLRLEGACEAHPLFVANSKASPVRVFEGTGSLAEGGVDEGDEDAEPTGVAGCDDDGGEQGGADGADGAGATNTAEGGDGACGACGAGADGTDDGDDGGCDAGALQACVEHEEGEENARAINSEGHEYTMGLDEAIQAIRAESFAPGDVEHQVLNPDRATAPVVPTATAVVPTPAGTPAQRKDAEVTVAEIEAIKLWLETDAPTGATAVQVTLKLEKRKKEVLQAMCRVLGCKRKTGSKKELADWLLVAASSVTVDSSAAVWVKWATEKLHGAAAAS